MHGKDMVAWRTSAGFVPYPDAVAFMERRVADIHDGRAAETVWLLEHPPLYTAGTSARPDELLDAMRLPVYPSGRGGRYTYHGPGQRVAYVMLDLRPRGCDVRAYVRRLEDWLIGALAGLGADAGRRPGRIGLWVGDGSEEAKIAAIGVRVRRWVTYHGVAVNVDPELAHFTGIVPCGVTGFGVTSLRALGIDSSMAEVDAALRDAFSAAFDVRIFDWS